MVAASSSQIPLIEITLAGSETPELIHNTTPPFTPHTRIVPNDCNSTRSNFLTPPIIMIPNDASLRRLSLQCRRGEGLERDKFDALLKSTRERNFRSYSKGSESLSKEVALKAHLSQKKQAERRALFQSKIKAPPSPSAIYMPRTPPESPAVYHCSLPSPGLKSPLAIFDDCDVDTRRETWIEQIEFYPLQEDFIGYGSASSNVVPSTNQISDLYGPHSENKQLLSTRFDSSVNTKYDSRDGAKEILSTNNNRQRAGSSSQSYLSPISPLIYPKLHMITTFISKPCSGSSSQLTRANLDVFNNRQRTASAMLSTIRKRTVEVK